MRSRLKRRRIEADKWLCGGTSGGKHILEREKGVLWSVGLLTLCAIVWLGLTGRPASGLKQNTSDAKEEQPISDLNSWEMSGLEDHEMAWNDSALEEYMRQQTKISEGPIMLSDVWEIQTIRHRFAGTLKNIEVLSELKNLRTLDITNEGGEGGLKGLKALSGLTKLTTLQLSYNEKITDFSPADNMPTVKKN